jgi:hypothetical protein
LNIDRVALGKFFEMLPGGGISRAKMGMIHVFSILVGCFLPAETAVDRLCVVKRSVIRIFHDYR